MAISPAVLRALAEAGATTEMVIAAVEADRQEEVARRAVKRAKDAERKRAERARNASTMSRGHDVTERDSDGRGVTPRDAKEGSPQTPLKENYPSSSLRSEEAEPDARTRLFRDGLSKLVEITGSTPTRLRSLLGKWLRDTNDDALRVYGVILKAAQDRPADPIPWIERHFRARAGPQSMPNRLVQLCDQPFEKTYDDYLAKHQDGGNSGDAGRNPAVAPPTLRAVSGAG